jgi:HEAT repeat protein
VLLGVVAGLLMLTSIAFAFLALGLRLRHDIRGRRSERMTKSWEPAMLEILGGAAPPQALFERVREGQGAHFLAFLMTYVRRLKGEELTLVRSMADPYLPDLVPMVREGSAEARGQAVMLLARLGMPKYADVVAGALRDPSPVVAMVAARSLFLPEQERHFAEVLAHLPRFARWSRSFLAGMLAGGGQAAAGRLRAILDDREQSPEVRAVAADALRAMNDLDSVDVATHLLEVETEREVIASCLRILKHLGHAEHAPVARRLAASPDPVVRAVAVSALGALGSHQDTALLTEKLDDPSFWVSLEAARGLLALGEVGTLRRLAASEGPWSTLSRQVLGE